jgi:hypothetical protein
MTPNAERDLLYLSHSGVGGQGKSMSRSSFIDRIAKWCDFAEFRRKRRSISRREHCIFFLCACRPSTTGSAAEAQAATAHKYSDPHIRP